jgi:hypothetical protein
LQAKHCCCKSKGRQVEYGSQDEESDGEPRKQLVSVTCPATVVDVFLQKSGECVLAS